MGAGKKVVVVPNFSVTNYLQAPYKIDRATYGWFRLGISPCYTDTGWAHRICDSARRKCQKLSGARAILKFAGDSQIAENVWRHLHL